MLQPQYKTCKTSSTTAGNSQVEAKVYTFRFDRMTNSHSSVMKFTKQILHTLSSKSLCSRYPAIYLTFLQLLPGNYVIGEASVFSAVSLSKICTILSWTDFLVAFGRRLMNERRGKCVCESVWRSHVGLFIGSTTR